eukprot:TRINITY_DN5815_c0_g1_i2.p1 TRINITY_DN5815_c0_g1~~TRINITY_DN5815_c0_g1_i2.p1  ORF type:complete len:891 (+),score=114.46 TRINITY_DN5815_c0_g1_i2:183-2675(+)
MTLEYTALGVTENYHFNDNKGLTSFRDQFLYTSGSACDHCHLQALLQPMPVLFRDLSIYSDDDLISDIRPAWELVAPASFHNGPFPVSKLWISWVTQALVAVQLTDGTVFKFYEHTEDDVSIPEVPSSCLCSSKLDVFILIHTSVDVDSANLQESLILAKGFLDNYNISDNKVNAALIGFGSTPKIISPLSSDRVGLENLLDISNWELSGQTGIVSAFETVGEMISSSSRSTASKMIVVIWNGNNPDSIITKSGANNLDQAASEFVDVVRALPTDTSVVVLGYEWRTTLNSFVDNAVTANIPQSVFKVINLQSSQHIALASQGVAGVSCSFEKRTFECCDYFGCGSCILPSTTAGGRNCSVSVPNPCKEYTCSPPNKGCHLSPKCPASDGCTTYTCDAENGGTCIANSTACKGKCTVKADCDICNGETCTEEGCAVDPNPEASPCDDGDFCTTDFCVNNKCVHTFTTCDVPANLQDLKCIDYVCKHNQCQGIVDPICDVSTDPDCVIYWSQWSACTGTCPVVGTRNRIQYTQGSSCPVQEVLAEQKEHCLLDCDGTSDGEEYSSYLTLFLGCKEKLTEPTWAVYLGYVNSGEYHNIQVGDRNKISIGGNVRQVANQPVMFLPGFSPVLFTVPITDIENEELTDITWTVDGKSISVTTTSISECPPGVDLLYEVKLLNTAVGMENIERVVYENLLNLIPNIENHRLDVEIVKINESKKRATEMTHEVRVRIDEGDYPLYDANNFVRSVRFLKSIDISDSLEGLEGYVGKHEGDLRIVTSSLGIRDPSYDDKLGGCVFFYSPFFYYFLRFPLFFVLYFVKFFPYFLLIFQGS